MIARLLYTLVLVLLAPAIVVRLLWRGRRQRAYLTHLGERIGCYRTRAAPPVIWLHAVSVGETRAAAPLIHALLAAYPQHHIVLTHMTPTGRATGQALFGALAPRVVCVYLPYDYPFAVTRFVRHFQPVLGLVMETELWPNVFAACHRAGVRLMLINARLSEKSARGYRRIAPLLRGCWQALDYVAAQTADDARRLHALGAQRVEALGNLKFDIDVPADQLAWGAAFKAQLGGRPVWLAASTREGEEASLLDAFAHAPRDALLLLVPRHPQRFDDVAKLVTTRGLTLARRSENRIPGQDIQVMLGDSMGELFAYYAAADVAFVGGSLLPLGGQNLIEACAVGVPVLVGPHTFNFAQVTHDALAAGAALQVDDAPQVIAHMARLQDDPTRCAAMRAAGLAFASAHRGATARVMARIETVMQPMQRGS